MATDLVFLLDVDNTLFDNDAFKAAIAAEALAVLGDEGAHLFWDLYEQVRRETATVDFPTTLRRLAAAGYEQESVRLGTFLDGYDFAAGLYPGTLPALRHLSTLGTCVILSDGDSVFQAHKISRSGLAAAVEGHVLIYVHKEQHLAEIEQHYPAMHYVMVDDKPRILAAIKAVWGTRVSTLFVCQGHYAAEAFAAGLPPVDLQVPSIGAVVTLDSSAFVPAPPARPSSKSPGSA